uniref:Uncharacterized protein n=1 Tax=Sphaerodactylus townsendi TaxID=933632 RepID=A0ACB8FM85_9SAUR
MKLVNWNVNGLRAGPGLAGLQWLLEVLDADVICLQETTITCESWRAQNEQQSHSFDSGALWKLITYV